MLSYGEKNLCFMLLVITTGYTYENTGDHYKSEAVLVSFSNVFWDFFFL